MSEQNKKEFQTPYEEYRVKAGYTRESASEELNGISPDKIYRIEKGKQTAAPDIVLQLADLYHAPELCNYHCTHKCEIGQKYIPQVDVQDLPSISKSIDSNHNGRKNIRWWNPRLRSNQHKTRRNLNRIWRIKIMDRENNPSKQTKWISILWRSGQTKKIGAVTNK